MISRHSECIYIEAIRTSDIFGKLLNQFRRRTEIDIDEAPLIFWLLAGYFRRNPELFKTEGLFRITSSNDKLRILELHLSQGNFPYLLTVKDPQLISNHWKRLMKEMKEPLIPFE